MTTALPELADGGFYYQSLGEGRYRSTIHAQGAWNPHEQHMAPASGIIADALVRHEPRDDVRLARISYEILGLIPGGEFQVSTSTLRPGRTIELIQAELSANGRVAIRAAAWRMITSDTSAVAAIEDEAMPAPDECKPWDGASVWPGGYIRSLEMRLAEGHRPGSGRVWIRTSHPLTDQADSTELARLMGLVDTANGIAARVPPGENSYIFPNVDLQIHMYRAPAGEWLGLDNKVSFGADGIGLTSTVLHDINGPFGRAEQILTLRKS
ncbi:Thioesterase-like superfamily protein [Arthrobacter sp. yr096]|uniref:thioesterase family protein n=1 Tax=unclassified Arthrobacter TaxID=235627 RepID=UPI00089A7BD4|nr:MULTISPECIES: thioesterase family protein [unclassified Arthrobacter]SDW48286.1 Thioesterase-like superfamily protein [Arthrobacter sp. cf158]SEJ69287.1 Thioesterase-like superfamily protein [Arthrobacter sp. yr096]